MYAIRSYYAHREPFEARPAAVALHRGQGSRPVEPGLEQVAGRRKLRQPPAQLGRNRNEFEKLRERAQLDEAGARRAALGSLLGVV